ncbi:hypothetical protein HY572_01670 [Candidatus Micrarchaeota archaeon]|nr:hypothetical protein [Candidatus Micrarchaeota archaeon]
MSEQNRPIKAHQFRFAYTDAKLDVSFWEGKEKDGKALPSSVSVRITDSDKGSVSMNPENALAVSAILQRYASEALELDTQRRLSAWKTRNPQAALATA